MASLLDDQRQDDGAPRTPAPRALVVAGRRVTQAAARFWAALFREVAGDYPACDRLVLETLSDVRLTRDWLYPERALQRAADRLRPGAPPGRAYREALQEVLLNGLPGSVTIRLLAGARDLWHGVLPGDCVDAEIFATLLAWLLEWAGLPEERWNAPRLAGTLIVRDPDTGWGGPLDLEAVRDHVSEGLYRWRVTLVLPRSAIGGDLT